MISYLPLLYDDELIYSYFSRIYAHSGYSAYTYFAKNIFKNPKQRIETEFINELTDEMREKLIGIKDMSAIINQHTLAPTYLHFAPYDNKSKAYIALISNDSSYKNKLTLSATGIPKYLKYCPLCASSDRNKYGEAFWHRSHQLEHIDTCHIHNVKLYSSSVSMGGKASPILHPAELEIPLLSDYLEDSNPLSADLVKYIISVLNTPISICNSAKMGKILHSYLYGTKYVSVRGEQRNITLLCTDLRNYFSNTKYKELIVDSRLQKLFTSHRHNFIEICLLAYYLHISPTQLCNRLPATENQTENFDKQVKELYKNGIGINQISRIMGVSSRTVCLTLKPAEAKKRDTKYTCGPLKKDWATIDTNTLPLVKNAIVKLLSSNRPKRITIFAITKELHLPDKTIYSLPLCLAEITKFHESQEEYWTREMIWAYHDTVANNALLQWTSIRRRTNLRRSNAIKCIPLLNKIGTKDAQDLIAIIQSERQ